MKQITPISMKDRCRQILILCVCAFSLTSCFDIESLPDKVKSDYEFAIPVVDTTVALGDFASFKQYELLLGQDIPAETPIRMGEQEYPFYIGDYSDSQEIDWVELLIIIDPKDLPSTTKVDVKIYTRNDSGEKSYDLVSDVIPLGQTYLKKIEGIEEKFRDAREVFLDTSLTFTDAVSGAQIMNYKVNIKFAIKFAITTDLKIKI
jgi:hypothetical protein